MTRKNFAILIALTVIVASPAIHARSVFLNGVNVSAVRNQTFEKASVTIDKKGNIYIDAPQYKIEVVDPESVNESPQAAPSKGGPNPLLAKRYYLVTQPSPEGRAQFDFVISVNGVEYKTIKAGSQQVIMEISAWLHKGDNELFIKARKNLSGASRKSTSQADEASVIVGTGHEEGKVVKIDKVKTKVKVNASQLSTIEKHFVLIAQ
ncbi:MAG: hypothetical protein GY847_08405 [Proteobacteria bacterium]|nr:hypothetical protein [Pseudomonadota bacterium]